jgi:hypothetical protein
MKIKRLFAVANEMDVDSFSLFWDGKVIGEKDDEGTPGEMGMTHCSRIVANSPRTWVAQKMVIDVTADSRWSAHVSASTNLHIRHAFSL